MRGARPAEKRTQEKNGANKMVTLTKPARHDKGRSNNGAICALHTGIGPWHRTQQRPNRMNLAKTAPLKARTGYTRAETGVPSVPTGELNHGRAIGLCNRRRRNVPIRHHLRRLHFGDVAVYKTIHPRLRNYTSASRLSDPSQQPSPQFWILLLSSSTSPEQKRQTSTAPTNGPDQKYIVNENAQD